MDKIFAVGMVVVVLFLLGALWLGYLIVSAIIAAVIHFWWLILLCVFVYFMAKSAWNETHF